jgi:hypothetical protein
MTTMVNGLPMAEFRFKRNWATVRGGWVQGRSEESNGWHSLVYVRSVKAADRYVRKLIARREDPRMFIELPIEKRTV